MYSTSSSNIQRARRISLYDVWRGLRSDQKRGSSWKAIVLRSSPRRARGGAQHQARPASRTIPHPTCRPNLMPQVHGRVTKRNRGRRGLDHHRPEVAKVHRSALPVPRRPRHRPDRCAPSWSQTFGYTSDSLKRFTADVDARIATRRTPVQVG